MATLGLLLLGLRGLLRKEELHALGDALALLYVPRLASQQASRPKPTHDSATSTTRIPPLSSTWRAGSLRHLSDFHTRM